MPIVWAVSSSWTRGEYGHIAAIEYSRLVRLIRRCSRAQHRNKGLCGSYVC